MYRFLVGKNGLFGENDRQLRDFYEQLPLGVTVEDYSHVKRRVDRLKKEGVHDFHRYLDENPEDRKAMIRSVEATGANKSMLRLYRVNSFQEYLDMYKDVSEWEKSGWADSYSRIIASLAQGETCFGEYTDATADGDTIHVGYVSWVLDGYDGDWSHVVTTHEDITERRRSEKKVRENEARLKALFGNASEGMFFKDAGGRYEMVNKVFANRIGYIDGSGIIGKTVFDLFPAEDAEDFRRDDIACMESRQASYKELDIPLPDGTEMTQFAIKFPIISEDDSVTGVGGIDVDITERKKLDRMKNEFISTVSHELRTPLTSIKGSLGLIVNGVAGECPEDMKAMMDVAYKNTNRLIGLVNDVLDMEKIASGAMEYDFRKIDLAHLVSEAIDVNRELLKEFGNRKIAMEIGGAVMISGDAKRLHQVMANLLSNAIKFTEEGGEISISVSCRGDKVEVSVADNGVGVPEEFRGQIFERFAQADATDSRRKGGSGLGLNITRAIVEKHGGAIGFESEPDAGSNFFFSLPIMK